MKRAVFLLLVLSATSMIASPVQPGRVISQLHFGDPEWREAIEPGERVTFYLAETYRDQIVQNGCAWCPALPTYVSYSVTADADAISSLLQINLLSYRGLPSSTFGVDSYTSGTLSYLDEDGELQQVPISQANSQQLPFPANLWNGIGYFRADLTNISSQRLNLINFGVATGATIPAGTFSSSAVAAPPPVPIPEPASWILLASSVLVIFPGAKFHKRLRSPSSIHRGVRMLP